MWGYFSEGLFNGSGSAIYNEGGFYKGDVKNDKMEGRGVYEPIKGGWRYDGDSKNGLKHGDGNLYYSDGDKFIGRYSND